MTKEELDAALAGLPALEQAPEGPRIDYRSPSARTLAGIARGPALDAYIDSHPSEEELTRRAAIRTQAVRVLRERCLAKLATAILQTRPWPKAAILLGPSGCGKTQAAKFLCLGRRAIWVKGADLAMADREHRLGAGEPPAVSEAKSAAMLVVDDIRSGQEVGSLWRIIDHRYDMCLPMIVTSGLRQFELLQHIGAAGVRRLIEQHCGTPVLGVNCHDSET